MAFRLILLLPQFRNSFVVYTVKRCYELEIVISLKKRSIHYKIVFVELLILKRLNNFSSTPINMKWKSISGDRRL